MNKTILITLCIYYLTFSDSCSQNLIDSLLIDSNKYKIEKILGRGYKFETMFSRFSKGTDQGFFKEKKRIDLSKSLFIYIDYSDISENIKSGIKLLLIDSETPNYKLHSEFWHVDYIKSGLKNYPGGMTSVGHGWILKEDNVFMNEVIYSMLCLKI